MTDDAKRNPLQVREHNALWRAQSKGLDKLVQYEGRDNEGNDTFAVPSSSRDLRHLVRAKLGDRTVAPIILSCSCEAFTQQAQQLGPEFARCTHGAAVQLYLNPAKVSIKPLPYSRTRPKRDPTPKDRDWTQDLEERSPETPRETHEARSTSEATYGPRHRQALV